MQLEDPIFHQLLNVLDSAGNGFVEDFIPPLRLWPSRKLSVIIDDVKLFANYIRKQLDEYRANFNSDNLKSLTDNIILAREQAKKHEDPAVAALFTDTHAVQTLTDVFTAGVDTTRVTLQWLLLVLATYPDVQEKIQAEVDSVIGDEIPGREHRSKLVYTEAVILETLRRHYVVPVGIPHQTLKDTKIGDYEIPAKTLVVSDNAAMICDIKYWEDPLTFKAERFIDETGTKLIARNKNWAPFSLGHRACIGESLAKTEMVFIVTGLLQELKFSLPPGAKEDFSPAGRGLVNPPPQYKVLVSSRKS